MCSISVEKYWENSWKYAPTKYLTLTASEDSSLKAGISSPWKLELVHLELKRKRGEQEIENTKIIAQAQAETIKQGKYAPVPDTVVVQDLKALGSVLDLMRPK